MMASDRPASLPIADPEETPPDAVPPAPSEPNPTRGTLKPSPFLNGFDLALVTGTIALAFAIASFAIKNSEFWLHIGTGRLIAQGQYEFGKAPFAYSGTDRYWTNHAWLYELGTYSLFNAAGGKALVIFKAILIAGLAAVLLLIRKPGQSLWLGVLTVGLGLLTAAPYLEMQPAICSYCFLGITLFLLLKTSARPNSWKLPIGIGITFWFWANCDQWFFLGPVVLALYLFGELVQRKVSIAVDGEARPSLRMLAIALGIGVVACMLNPHHVRIWQWPAEVLPGHLKTVLGKEPEINYLFRTLFDKGTLDLDASHDGNPVNAVSFFFLVFLNILGYALNVRRISVALVLVNVAMLGLAIVHARALPFYVIVAAPVTALNLGQAIAGFRQRTFMPRTLHALAAGRAGIRMGLLVAGLLALGAAYPGWLHPIGAERRLAWTADPDPNLVRASQALQRLRDGGKIPSEAHSLTLNPDLAHYCAWYAPSEKSFFDLRLGFHAPEADTFVKLKSSLHVRTKRNAKPGEYDVSRFLTEQKITHFVVSAADRQEVIETMVQRLFPRKRSADMVERNWELWDLQGKAAILGWTHQKVMTSEQFQSQQFAPIALAFGPAATRIPDLTSIAPPEKRGFIEKFTTPLPAASSDSDEAFLQYVFQRILLDDVSRWNNVALEVFLAVNSTSLAPAAYAVASAFSQERIPIPHIRALAVHNIRTARRGILESPTAAEGYLALARSYGSNGWVGWTDDRRDLMIVANLERYVARLSPEQLAKPDQNVVDASLELYSRHSQRNANRLDLAIESLRRTIAALRARSALATNPAAFAEGVRQFEAQLTQMEKLHRDQENIWLNNITGTVSPVERVRVAQNLGLYRRSLQELNSIILGQSSKLTPEEQIGVLLERIRLDLLTGQVEEAEAIVRELDESPPELLSRPIFGQIFSERKFDTLFLLGRLSEAASVLAQNGSERSASLAALLQRGELASILYLHAIRKLGETPGLSLTELLTVFQPPLYEIALRRYLGNFAEQEQIHLKLAMTYLELGDNAAATDQFEKIIKTADARARMERGLLGFDSLPQLNSALNTATSYLDLLKLGAGK